MKKLEVQIAVSITNDDQDYTDVFRTALDVVERIENLDLDFEVEVIASEVDDA